MSNAITIYDRITDPIDAMERLGKVFAMSGMFGCKDVAQGQVMALACMCERQTPVEFARVYHIIDGRITMRADAMLAEFLKLGNRVVWLQMDDDGARATFTTAMQEITMEYMVADAERAGYLPADPKKPNSNWARHPGAMMRARLISRAVRALAPGVCAGFYAPEEVSDGGAIDESEPVAVAAIFKELEAPKAADPERISLEAVLSTIDGYDPATALQWLVRHKWLDDGQSFGDLTEDHATKIAQAPARFVAKANEEASNAAA